MFLAVENTSVFMRRFFCGILLVFALTSACPQSARLKDRKYPSLLWEISGNGLQKPSYLFGTMHVSSKMVFNLSDSFYRAIRSADVVALETNPESWQEDMFRFNFENEVGNVYLNSATGYHHAPEEYLSIQSLKISPYEKLIEAALASNPSTINNLLYRSYSDGHNDFEEDTYLDLYIYQVGKKWGKRIFGVEQYAESMKLAMEAYVDAMKDKNKRDRSFDVDEDFSYARLQEAYRTGNLDLLDTINRLNSFSPLFDEKFLYKRNDIQAASVDSVLRAGTALFVGVGAAHLPGQRGVIEILRRLGYTLRPIKMGERNSQHKELIEKLKVPVVFGRQTSLDGFYKVEVPGKLYRFANSFNGFDQVQYADMANGSYYAVTRIQTNALLWGHSENDVFKKADSSLYENIPGKILLKQAIVKNGYKGFDITNRTRRGDYQRYQIFCTPFEVVLFKVSGNGEYVKASAVADKFFNSIQLKEYGSQWKKYSPSFGGFEIDMPHEPYVIKNSGWQFMSADKVSKADFRVVRIDIHNYNFAEEDSFDLTLLEESFTGSDFFDRIITRKQITYKGYPALDAKYQYKDGSVALVRYLIQGPHYYTLMAHAKTEQPRMTQFLNSFSITPFQYKEAREQVDTNLYYSVKTPFYPARKNALGMPGGFGNLYLGSWDEEDEPAMEQTVYRDKLISNDTTGEKIYISFYKPPRYFYTKDSVDLKKQDRFQNKETSWIINTKKFTDDAGGKKTWEYVLTDTSSSRGVWTKTFYRNGVSYTLRTEVDTVTKPSAFLTQFFESFQPSDTVQGIDPLTKKTAAFFDDFFSADTTAHKRAMKSIMIVSFEPSDLPQLKKAINSLSWKDKNYVRVKKDFINKLGSLTDPATSTYLKDLYYAARDTIEFQYEALEALLQQKTKYAYTGFKDILLSDPPVINLPSVYDEDTSEDSFFDHLCDSLKLTSVIIKDLLPLLDVDDYKHPIMRLMQTLMDSNLLTAKDYEAYASKFLLEAKQAWKKQSIAEKKKSIGKAQETDDRAEMKGQDEGNEALSRYAGLLMPFWENNQAVSALLKQLLGSNDQQLKYQTMLLFIRHEKPVADSMLQFFASNDVYRYPLFVDLSGLKKALLFPSKYKNHIDLAKSKLRNTGIYNEPDSIVFLQRLPLQVAKKNGFVYFFKYRIKKEEAHWKIASVGLVPADATRFEFDEEGLYDYDFTVLSDVKLKEDEPVRDQLEKRLRQLMFTKHASAKQFYKNEDKAMNSFKELYK